MFLETKAKIWALIIVTLVFLVVMFFMILVISIANNKGYKDGQIDALTGNIKYELIENERKEMYWKKIVKKEE